MKASVQYNDFKGTAAADISDHTSLNNFIENRGVDINRYKAIGAEFYSGYSDYFSASFICEDKELSTEQKKHFVGINFENDISKDEFFELFKRFNVVIKERFGGLENLEIEEVITIDDRNPK
jgi:hypothetical protein